MNQEPRLQPVYDLNYSRINSLLLDNAIYVQTISVVLSGQGIWLMKGENRNGLPVSADCLHLFLG